MLGGGGGGGRGVCRGWICRLNVLGGGGVGGMETGFKGGVVLVRGRGGEDRCVG